MRKEIRRRRIVWIARWMCVCICVVACCAGIGSCSGKGGGSKADSADSVTKAEVTAQAAADSATQGGTQYGKGYRRYNEPETEVRDVTLFGVRTKSSEGDAVRDLAAAGILKVEELREENGEFNGAVVEFGDVKFGLSSGFTFITSRHDKKAIKGLIKMISKYYGEPEIDGDEEPQYNYYHWNLYKQDPDAPSICIRPLHSEDDGLIMLWEP